MAIIIPSKHIYEIRNNKIIENRIDKVEVIATKITPVNEFEKVVYSENIDISSITNESQFEEYEKSDDEKEAYVVRAGDASTYMRFYLYTYFANKTKYLNGTIKFPKLRKNERIDSIKKFEFSVYGSIEKAKTIGTAFFSTTSYVMDLTSLSHTARTTNEKVFDYPEMPERIEENQSGHLVPMEVVNVGLPNISTYSFSENSEEFIVDFKCLISYTKETLICNGEATTSGNVDGEGEYAFYNPSQLRVSVYGNTSAIELEEENQKYGNAEEKGSFSIQNNELLQTTNYITFIGVDNNQSINYNVSRTREQYAKGKESATILCSISDYYDQNGNKIININDTTDNPRMLFEEFDLVIPYIYNAKGQDEPMSVDKQNVAKTFVVVGVEPFYDGAVWQRLYLLEKTQEKQT